MNHPYKDALKPFISQQLTECAKELSLTQEQIAELLEIDTRSYVYLQAGVYMCSATTLLLFLTRVCPNPEQFLKEAKEYFDKFKNGASLCP